jgi:hypothetical protein
LRGLVVLISIRALAGDVLLLKSANADEYNKAFDGFGNGYSGKSDEDESWKNEFLRRISASKPRLIVAVGRVAVEVARDRPKDVPVILLRVSNPVGRDFTVL